jgi:hypothetical protein
MTLSQCHDSWQLPWQQVDRTVKRVKTHALLLAYSFLSFLLFYIFNLPTPSGEVDLWVYLLFFANKKVSFTAHYRYHNSENEKGPSLGVKTSNTIINTYI